MVAERANPEMAASSGGTVDFGCERCWPPDAGAAWEVSRGLTHGPRLIDESHYDVRIRACPICNQQFIAVFTEEIDWVCGDDSQDVTLLPITGEEAAALVEQRESFVETHLHGLAPRRRCLRYIDPTGGAAPSIVWGTGIFVGPHD
jgi:hypothetical protein